jgi:hypothetical protein
MVGQLPDPGHLRELVKKLPFVPPDDVVLDVAQVAHASKKKKTSLLCLIVSGKGEGSLLQVSSFKPPPSS